ncbi:DUF3772 domain-containing protein [Sphingomonas parapaucimobilis]|uniref:Putative small-conductance mechanosensitive channel n=1 Tax=Sphingomonas parapaucimobilis NBRC 15100 TaxID=1219049 RepID=A0A0A1W5N4_9SPHN|nr:DUF3772 domain-containing protein [Sphingomonas parapaucimobilis]GAM00451.1 putative small-conductance mechanosensitive channel [Sphingomonas parapaucimobilis NBRC 15100]
MSRSFLAPFAVLRILVLACIMVGLVGTGVPVSAQGNPATASATRIAEAEAEVRAVDRALDSKVDDDDRRALRDRAQGAKDSTGQAVSDLTEQLALVNARITGLGTPTPGEVEAPELVAQRKALSTLRSTIDAAIKRGRLAGVEAGQLVDEIDQSKAAQFNEKLSSKTPSPLSPAFWSIVLEQAPRDWRRVGLFLKQGGEQIAAQWRGGIPWQALLGFALAVILIGPVRLGAHRLAQRRLIAEAPPSRVRRSAYTFWRVAVGTLCPLAAAFVFVQGLRWAGLLPQRWTSFLDGFVFAAGVAGFTAAVTGAVLMRSQPSWRIAPLDDETAQRLRPLSWGLTLLTFITTMVMSFEGAIGSSRSAVIASQAVEALLHLLLIVTTLVVLGQLRARRVAQADAATHAPIHAGVSAGLSVAALIAWIAVGVAGLALLVGYIWFSWFVALMIGWTVLLGSALYLMLVAADDIATSVFVRDSKVGITLTRALGVRGSMIDQLGLVLSGMIRLVLVLLTLGVLLQPFGASGDPGAVFDQIASVADGVRIGNVWISPGAILRGLAVLFVGLGLVRLFMRWLEQRYLPATDLDGSGRNSVSLVARYIGIALAVIWALASLGIGVERIALLLSALSVGIGFGLQAITQNFVSGLILLAERPIKIGDLIRVGTDEGDVKRISVRSTEIELADHSTLIVPNSELITKPVLNKTLAGPLGRVQIQFSVPIETDADMVRGIVLDCFTAEEAVLADPAPKAFIDSIVDGRIHFNCFAHVESPRAAYGTRSAVLFALLGALRGKGIEIGTLPQKMELVRHGGPATPAAPAPQGEDETRMK